jgi:ABC-2 type transport system permease protein
MRAALVIALKDLKQRLRDRSALVVAFVAPLGLAIIITAAVGGGFSGDFKATYAVFDEDASAISTAFSKQVLAAPQFSDQIKVVQARSVAEVRELVSRGAASAAFLIPRGFEAAVTGNRRALITVLRNPDAEIGSAVAEALARAYTDQINAGRLSVLTTIRATGAPPDPAAVNNLARAAAAERIPIELVDGPVGVKEVSGAGYFGPAMAIFFLFFSTSFVARSLLAEREQGTLPRVLAAPVHRASIIAGKALTGLAVGLMSLTVMFLIFGLFLDIDWGDPITLAVLSVATVLAVMGVTAVVQSFARTQEQADAYSNIVGVLLALVGGSFFPIFQMPDLVQRISLIAPNAWALRGFNDIVYDGATLADLGPNLAVILAFTIVTGTLAVTRARRLSL